MDFNNLPTEIRLMIFKAMLPSSRFIRLDPGERWKVPSSFWETPSPGQSYEAHHNTLPITLHINSESRRETLKRYILVLRSVEWAEAPCQSLANYESAILDELKVIHTPPKKESWLCFNPRRDRFCLDFLSFDYFNRLGSRNPTLFDNIKKLEIRHDRPSGEGNFLETLQDFRKYYFGLFDKGTSHEILSLLYLRNLELIVIRPLKECGPSDDRRPAGFLTTAKNVLKFAELLVEFDPARKMPHIFIPGQETGEWMEIHPKVDKDQARVNAAYRKAFREEVQVLLKDFSTFKELDKSLVEPTLSWRDVELGVARVPNHRGR